MRFYAHTAKGVDDSFATTEEWEPLFTPDCGTVRGDSCEECRTLHPPHGHLNKVAYLCGQFAAEMFPSESSVSLARKWGEIAGWWHDLGKFSREWQAYLKSRADPHAGELSGKVDHSTAGAKHAVRQHLLGHLLAYPIAGHHSGLLDANSSHACQKQRLEKDLAEIVDTATTELLSKPVPEAPQFLVEAIQNNNAFSISFFIRMLFSCLVDADFLATEAFTNPQQSGARNRIPEDAIDRILHLVSSRIEEFGVPSRGDSVNFYRQKVVSDCRAAADLNQGLFTLTVPTGGGKTLSSLLFALLHARRYGHKQIIFVVPFTSIIEQNGEVIRQVLAPLQTDDFTPLIEHHSAFAADRETNQSRLACENWEAPVIITTAVQFYESLMAAKTSACRKLHNIANSVIILDEAQTLPVDFLKPCLRTIQELTNHYHVTAVLCTATQPAVKHNPSEFPIGLLGCREIIQDTKSLFSALKRVEVKTMGTISDAELCSRLLQHSQVLCVVNRRKHAKELFRLMKHDEANFHLSALMCAEHRTRVLDEVRGRLRANLSVRLISTQLIEAGVDVDFPVVYRSLAGLDSIAQSAGRCNRNGRLPGLGTTFVFSPEDDRGETYFRETAQISRQLLELYPDVIGEDAIDHYFDLYYYQQKLRWDSKGILDEENLRLDGRDRSLPFHFQFASIAQDFQLISDWRVPIIIPFNKKAYALITQLRNPSIPLNRKLLRALQRFTVSIPSKIRNDKMCSFEILRDGQFYVLVSCDLNYSDSFGVTFDEEDSTGAKLIC